MTEAEFLRTLHEQVRPQGVSLDVWRAYVEASQAAHAEQLRREEVLRLRVEEYQRAWASAFRGLFVDD